MNSKPTDNSQPKKTMPEDWSPISSVERKTKSANEQVGELAEETIGDMSPNRNVISDNANTTESKDRTNATDSLQTGLTTVKRISGKQRKESLDEYRETFLQVPKLEDRKPVFISREVRDSLDEITRKLGGRRMSVSGFIENLARHHLEIYQDEIENWKKL